MAEGGETPGFERVPQAPEGSIETPAAGAAFETPAAPAAERPAAPVVQAAPVQAAPAAAPAAKDQVMKDVEHVLEEGLADVYRKMNPQQQRKFSVEGDKAARSISEMVRAAKVQARAVLSILTKWLRIIPGVNRFFLDQEAKIKTDKILALASKGKLP